MQRDLPIFFMYSITIKKNLYCFKICKYLFILWTEQFVYEKKNLLNENDIKMLKIVDIYNKKCFKNKKEMLFWKFVGHFCWSSKYFISVHSGFLPLNKSLLMMIGQVSSELTMFAGRALEVKEQHRDLVHQGELAQSALYHLSRLLLQHRVDVLPENISSLWSSRPMRAQ